MSDSETVENILQVIQSPGYAVYWMDEGDPVWIRRINYVALVEFKDGFQGVVPLDDMFESGRLFGVEDENMCGWYPVGDDETRDLLIERANKMRQEHDRQKAEREGKAS